MQDWFYRKGTAEHGPVTRDELAELAACGELGPLDSVRFGQHGSWTRPHSSLFTDRQLQAGGIVLGDLAPVHDDDTDIFVLDRKVISGPFTGRQARSHFLARHFSADCKVRRGVDGVWRTPTEDWRQPRVIYLPFPLATIYNCIMFAVDLSESCANKLAIENRFARACFQVPFSIIVGLSLAAGIILLVALVLAAFHGC